MSHVAEANEQKEKGNKAMQSGRFEEAVRCYNIACNIDTDNPIHFCNRSLAFCKLAKFKEALDDATRAIHLNPEYGKVVLS